MRMAPSPRSTTSAAPLCMGSRPPCGRRMFPVQRPVAMHARKQPEEPKAPPEPRDNDKGLTMQKLDLRLDHLFDMIDKGLLDLEPE
jgi:hypothetical protein